MALSPRRSNAVGPSPVGLAAAFLATLLIGCANPAPPRAPSLFLPAPVTKISASRIGNAVEVRFTVPARSTDNLPLRAPQLTGMLCRQSETTPCRAVISKIAVDAKGPDGQPNVVTWRDTLPPDLASGPAHAIAYRVEFFNASDVSGGKSDPVIAAAGQTPPAVTGLTAEGSRSGTILRWKPLSANTAEVLIRREDINAHAGSSRKNPESDVTWLNTDATSPGRVLDVTAQPNVSYRYTAQRRFTAQAGGRELEMRSDESASVNFTLREIYAPSAPSGLTAVGFSTGASQFAVDLIWQPVNEAAVTGYNVYRQPIDANGAPLSARSHINADKINLPGFHDAAASAGARYRYEVTAIDGHGNESPATSALLEPAAH